MIIDFCGLPGSGKSFYANAFSQRCLSNKIICINLTDRIYFHLLWKIYFRVLKFFFFKTTKCRRKKSEMKNILAEYLNRSALFNKSTVRYYIDSLLFIRYLHAKYKNKTHIYIYDEGVIQQFATMIANFKIPIATIKCVYETLQDDVKTIFFESTINRSFELMRKRNRHVCSIDELTENQAKDFLLSYNKALVVLNECFELKNIKCDKSMEAILDDIDSFVRNKSYDF